MRQVKVSVCETKIPKRVFRTYFVSRQNERGLVINEEAALLSPWQWRFEVDRMRSRFASNVDIGPYQPARFLKSFVYYLQAVALIGLVTGEEENEGEESDLSLRRCFLR